MTLYVPYHSQGWHGRIANGWQALLEDMDRWLAVNPGESVVDFPSREVRRVATPAGPVYVKILRSGGDARGPHRWINNLKWYLRPSRALAILHVSQSLLAEGFVCPVPILAARYRSPAGWPTELFISHERLGTSLAQRLSTAEDAEATRTVLASTANELRRFHRAGFVHGDCTPYNLAFTDEGRLILFDNDRTRRGPAWLRQHHQERSLANLGLRLTQLTQNPEPFQIFLDRYADSAAEAERILSLSRKRLKSKGLDFS
jgi:hypothetical protein